MDKQFENTAPAAPQAPPAIQGLTFRRIRGSVDYPHMLAVIEASYRADGIQHKITLEELAHNYDHLTNCDPHTDMLMVEGDGELIGYIRAFWDKETEGNYVYNHVGFLLPAWRRHGIGTYLLRAAEARLREIASDHPASDRYFETWATEEEVAAHALFEAEGYHIARTAYEMTRDLAQPIPELELPEGLTLRSAEPDQDRAIWDAYQEAFRDHWGHRQTTEADYERWRSSPSHDRGLWQVAWDGDVVVGMVLNFILPEENEEYSRRRGYTEDICVRRPWRGQGVASALIANSLRTLRELEMTEAALTVDSKNRSGALKLYQKMGYEVDNQTATYRKRMDGRL